jgi:hypothetical protein
LNNFSTACSIDSVIPLVLSSPPRQVPQLPLSALQVFFSSAAPVNALEKPNGQTIIEA